MAALSQAVVVVEDGLLPVQVDQPGIADDPDQIDHHEQQQHLALQAKPYQAPIHEHLASRVRAKEGGSRSNHLLCLSE